MKIYTKTGDKGKTALIGGKRVNKNDTRLEAYGTIDELNSFVGLLISFLPDEDENKNFLFDIQNTLFDLGSDLALDTENADAKKYNIAFDEQKIQKLEAEIDRISENLPALKQFLLPGGSQTAAFCHTCRTIARRAERNISTMSETFFVQKELFEYINRLSDYFFVLARFMNKNINKEIFYVKQ
jgi:cob(I)alamin adenosyltransferase